jgi:hypothetical protein
MSTDSVFDHSTCIPTDTGFTRCHTHEGQKGTWLFDSEATPEDRARAAASVSATLAGWTAPDSPVSTEETAAPAYTRVEFPDGSYDYFGSGTGEGPRVTVRFGDGAQVTYRTDGEWPRHAWVKYAGYEHAGTRYDVEAGIEPSGRVSMFSVWKTGVAGIDGGGVIPAGVTGALTRLACRRAREARTALAAAGGWKVKP